MTRRVVANLDVSAIGRGCMGMSAFYGSAYEDEVVATIRRALDLGCTFHDAADGRRRNGALIRSGLARKLSFTGSTAVGRRLLEQCADKVLRTSMELGSNAAFIVFPDADLDAAVEDAVAEGAEVLIGGQAAVPETALMRHEEIFGPVAPLSAFKSEAEVIKAANDTDFGLINYVYTNDLTRALRVAEGLESGMVGLNRGCHIEPIRAVRRSQGIGTRTRRWTIRNR